MNWLPSTDLLGELTLEDTLVFYDGPRIFTARSLTNQIYLALWASEGDDEDSWLYIPISPARLERVRSGRIPLRSAFKNPEGFIYQVFLPNSLDGADSIQTISADNLSDELLPLEEFRLNIPTATLPAADNEVQIERRARQENRTRFQIEVVFPGYRVSEAPTRKIGDLLIATQNVYDNIGMAIIERDPPQQGRIPSKILEQTQSDFVGIKAASFVIELAATQTDDLFDSSTFSEATKTLLTLLDTHLERPRLLEELQNLRPRGAKSFRKFVQNLAKMESNIVFLGAGAAFSTTKRSLTSQNIEDLNRSLNSLVPDEFLEIRGRMQMFRGDMIRKNFGLLDLSDNTRYEGRISPRALTQADHEATFGDMYDVIISSYSVFDDVVGESRPKYVLEQLVRASGDPYPTTITVVPVEDE